MPSKDVPASTPSTGRGEKWTLNSIRWAFRNSVNVRAKYGQLGGVPTPALKVQLTGMVSQDSYLMNDLYNFLEPLFRPLEETCRGSLP